MNVSACGSAGRWVLGGCEIPSLRHSTLASTPGGHTGLGYKNTATHIALEASTERRKNNNMQPFSKKLCSKAEAAAKLVTVREFNNHATFCLSVSVPLLLHQNNLFQQTPAAYNGLSVYPTSLCVSVCFSECLCEYVSSGLSQMLPK